MEDLNPLRSLNIDPALLADCVLERARPPNNQVFSLITTKTHPTLPLAIHNYTNKSAYLRQGWDDLGLAARTLITEITTGKVVSRSLPKFFNYHEDFAYKPTGDEHAFSIEEKVDGSLISLFWYHDQWITVSRTAFESTHASAARRILDKIYPGTLDRLDKEKTYVFELVDPTMPIKVVYKQEDLVILSIVSKDGKEPPYDFDWTTLPFSRPRMHAALAVDSKHLSNLNIDNEEGFVVKFWSTPDDTYPKRIKVKFQSYLKADKLKVRFGNLALESSSPSLPTNAWILEIYTKHRMKIQHFKPPIILSTMEGHKKRYLESLEPIADDYGGAEWIQLIEKTWDRIDAIFVLEAAKMKDHTSSLLREGYKPSVLNGKSQTAQDEFVKRVRRTDADPRFQDALVSWFLCEPVVKQLGYFVKHMEVPADLRSSSLIELSSF